MSVEPAGAAVHRRFVARCHANAAEDYRAFARGSAGGAIEEGPGFAFISTAAADSMGNPAFVSEPASDPPRMVERATAFFSKHHVPWILIAFPEATESLRSAATAGGLLDEGEFPGMVLDPIPGRIPPPPRDFRVERATNREQLELIERTGAAAYGMPYSAPDVRWLDVPGLGLYLGLYRGEPVSLGALIVAHGVAGVAYIGTVGAFRRRGFAEAVVWQIVSDGRDHGCDVAYLWATPMGRTVYERMGFRRLLDYHIWSSPGDPMPKEIRRAEGARS
jgi:GNAT superfamily N-acetyltransferase